MVLVCDASCGKALLLACNFFLSRPDELRRKLWEAAVPSSSLTKRLGLLLDLLVLELVDDPSLSQDMIHWITQALKRTTKS